MKRCAMRIPQPGPASPGAGPVDAAHAGHFASEHSPTGCSDAAQAAVSSARRQPTMQVASSHAHPATHSTKVAQAPLN